ncbi:MAG TPA: choice-of-anchor C family protein [Polyangia bacterium]|nr:choice-of-anchor C family protein [Polyangia bacterium]
MACALGALAVSRPLHAAPFTNGSFEVGPGIGGSFLTLSSGNTSITGWTVLPSSVDYIGSLWTAEDGTHSLDLSGAAPGGVAQTFDTNPGRSYDVAFYLAANTDCGAAVKGVDVGATGSSTSHYTFDGTGHSPSSMGWQQEHYAFVATATSTTLSFLSTESSVCGPALDDVSVTSGAAVPALPPMAREAAPLLLLAAGLLALGRARPASR